MVPSDSAKLEILMEYFCGEHLTKGFYFKMKIDKWITIKNQLLNAVNCLHNLNVVHRDIKPDNFLIGYSDKQKYIYTIDFGLCSNSLEIVGIDALIR